MIQEANKQAAAIKAKAESDIAQEKKKSGQRTQRRDRWNGNGDCRQGDRAEISEKDHEKLIDEFISNVGEAS